MTFSRDDGGYLTGQLLIAMPSMRDPRFTRTSALCDIHAPIRAGTDIVFLGAIINHVIHSERWKTDSAMVIVSIDISPRLSGNAALNSCG